MEKYLVGGFLIYLYFKRKCDFMIRESTCKSRWCERTTKVSVRTHLCPLLNFIKKKISCLIDFLHAMIYLHLSNRLNLNQFVGKKAFSE